MNGNRERLIQKLGEQLRFMQRSCVMFDQGYEDEAIRIATSLRVIFHHTVSSVSLVSHVGLNGTPMLSSSRGHAPGPRRSFTAALAWPTGSSAPLAISEGTSPIPRNGVLTNITRSKECKPWLMALTLHLPQTGHT